MKLAVADPKFSPQTVTEAIRKTRGSIMKDAGRIHFIHELFGSSGVFRENAVRMARTILINMVDGLAQTAHDFDGDLQIAIFGMPVFFCSGNDLKTTAELRGT